MTNEAIPVYLQDRSSGRLHKAYMEPDGSKFTREGCNLDDAGAADEVDFDVVVNAETEALCANDFPDIILARTLPEPDAA